MEAISDYETNYRVRSKAQLIAMQAEIMLELRDQIRACLDNPTDPKRYEKIRDICGALANLTWGNDRLIKELQDDIAERERKVQAILNRTL